MSDCSFNSPRPPPLSAFAGRGPAINPPNRFERLHVACDAGTWQADLEGFPDERPDPRTQFFYDATETILSRNDSPDIPFTHGINCYRGCEHGCAYCFARPYHEYLGWSSGLDFETKILVKLRGPELLRQELSSPKWKPELITMSGATDCYQPAERHFQLTRKCLEVFAEFRNPVGLITKNFLITRDRDILAELARHGCVSAHITVTSLDSELAGKLEPRAARPEHRLRAISLLAEAGVPVGVMVAPIVPGLTDHEIPAILDAAKAAGAQQAGYVVLRLPHAVKEIFTAWLDQHFPSKKERVLARVRELRGGKLNVAEWGKRMVGEGIYAEQIHDLFAVAARRVGMNRNFDVTTTANFRRPGGVQMRLF